MVVIHLFLVLERLRVAGASPEAEAAAQALVDAFVTDIDDSLRELGTGDVGVPRRVKRAAAGFYARATVTLGAAPVADVLDGRLFFPDPSIAVKSAP